MEPLISIGIPNYNRAKELLRLLNSIDTAYGDEIEIVIYDDKSPEIEIVRSVVNEFKKKTKYEVLFIENEKNCGYDKNLRNVIKASKGKWVLFMGNDDTFIPGSLDKLMEFLKENSQLGYVLRSYRLVHKNHKIEQFRYYHENKFFKPGLEAYTALFRKSVFISGFTIRKDLVLPYLVDTFDATLLFQLYLVGEVALNYPSAYFDEPLTQLYEERGLPEFGNAEVEKGLYRPKMMSIDNDINFFTGFFRISAFLDKKYHLYSTVLIKRDLSKYFYPRLAEHRKYGIKHFLKYARAMNALGLSATVYYYMYVVGLLVLGKKICDNVIVMLKGVLGSTPRL